MTCSDDDDGNDDDDHDEDNNDDTHYMYRWECTNYIGLSTNDKHDDVDSYANAEDVDDENGDDEIYDSRNTYST